MDALTAALQRLEWTRHAACAGMEPQAFFVEAGSAIDPAVAEVCSGCPVRRDCLVLAYRNSAGAGYFAGMSPGDRRDIPLEQALAALDQGREPGVSR